MALSVDIKLALQGFSLQVAHRFDSQGITALFGPSGAGKSTLLRVIAGLESKAAGHVQFESEIWQRSGKFTPPHKRGVGYVFQDARLFEHLNVERNLRFAEKRSRELLGNITFDGVVKTLDLSPLLKRAPSGLSGGERQRVAIGRALLSQPRLLLMDEPLAALDHDRKARLLPYIARLPQAFNLPIIYVTHSVEEVTRLADQMLVLSNGAIVASGGVAETLARLDIAQASGRFEAGTVVSAVVTTPRSKFRLTEMQVAGQALSMPASAVKVGEALRLRIRARDVAIALKRPEGLSIRNILAGEVIEISEEPDSAFAEILLDIGEGQNVRARITQASVSDLKLSKGLRVFALVKSISFDRRALPKA